MKIYFNSFWDGFINKKNPVNISFFLDLFEIIFNIKCNIGNINDSDILCESFFGQSVLNYKKWKYSFFFSGESSNREDTKFTINDISKYSIILCGKRNNDNIINCPLFIPYLYCNNKITFLEDNRIIENIPKKDIIAIISNPNGIIRNRFLNELEKKHKIVYAGRYKNNTNYELKDEYNTDSFYDYIKQFKIIVSMENSIDDTYITEKITHGLIAGILPVYWGSERISDYINSERIIILNNDINDTINKIDEILNDNSKYLDIVNKNCFTHNKLWRDIYDIARDIKNKLFNNNKFFQSISQVYFICNKQNEEFRYNRLNKIITELNISKEQYQFMAPTYKYDINNEIYNKYVKSKFIIDNRYIKKSELSLFLNFYEILKDIDKRYLDGIFITLESDIIIDENINNINILIDKIVQNKENINLVSIGKGYEHRIIKNLGETYSNHYDKVRLIKMNETRCTDSFIWTKEGINIFLNYIENKNDINEPIDHFINNFLKNINNFNMYWSIPHFFIQTTSNMGEKSTIQSDKV